MPIRSASCCRFATAEIPSGNVEHVFNVPVTEFRNDRDFARGTVASASVLAR